MPTSKLKDLLQRTGETLSNTYDPWGNNRDYSLETATKTFSNVYDVILYEFDGLDELLEVKDIDNYDSEEVIRDKLFLDVNDTIGYKVLQLDYILFSGIRPENAIFEILQKRNWKNR